MALTAMAFTPSDGVKNSTSFPNPANGTAARKQIQDILDQIKDYINNTLRAELAATDTDASGSHSIGYDHAVYTTVADCLDAVLAAGAGSIPPNNSITTAKIVDANVTEDKLAAGSVTETKIGALAVTEGKIGALAVTAAKIAADTITEAKMAAAMKKQSGGVAEYDTVAAQGLVLTAIAGRKLRRYMGVMYEG